MARDKFDQLDSQRQLIRLEQRLVDEQIAELKPDQTRRRKQLEQERAELEQQYQTARAELVQHIHNRELIQDIWQGVIIFAVAMVLFLLLFTVIF